MFIADLLADSTGIKPGRVPVSLYEIAVRDQEGGGQGRLMRLADWLAYSGQLETISCHRPTGIAGAFAPVMP
jgi:hypothetical protein